MTNRLTNTVSGGRFAAYHRVDVPSNAPSWRLRLRVDSGGAMMVVRPGTIPTTVWRQSYNQSFANRETLGVRKAGNEEFLILPDTGRTNIGGSYYVGVVNDGSLSNTVAEAVLENLGVLPVTDLGTLPIGGGASHTNTVPGGGYVAYRVTVATNTPILEARLTDGVGTPRLWMIPGATLPDARAYVSALGNDDAYGLSGGLVAGGFGHPSLLSGGKCQGGRSAVQSTRDLIDADAGQPQPTRHRTCAEPPQRLRPRPALAAWPSPTPPALPAHWNDR